MEENKNNFFEEQTQPPQTPGQAPLVEEKNTNGLFDSLKLRISGVLSSLEGVFNRLNNKKTLMAAGAVFGLGLLYFFFSYTLIPLLKNQSSTPPVDIPKYKQIIQEGGPTIIKRSANEAVAVVHLRNPNKEVGLKNLSYAWKALDEQNDILQEGSGTAYILPEQDRYLVIPFKNFIPESLEFSLSPHVDQYEQPEFIDELKISVVNQYKAVESNKHTVGADIYNESAYRVENVDITVLYFNNLNKIVGAAATTIGPLDPQDTQNFEVFWPELPSEGVIAQIRLSVDRFSSLNITLP